MLTIQTSPYRLSRLRLAYLAAEEYLRSFWFFVVGFPIAGVLGIIYGDRVIQALGMFALFWPFSIPARAILLTSKASRLFTSGVVLKVGPEGFDFQGTQPDRKGKPLRLLIPANRVRDVVRRQGMLLIRTYRMSFAPVDPAAFANDAEREAFESSLAGPGTALDR